MITTRTYHHKEDRDVVLLSFVPVGEYFQIVTEKYNIPELKDMPPDIPYGLFRKICFQTDYGKFNIMDVFTGEIHSYRDDCKCIRLLIKDVVEFDEARFDRPINKGKEK